MQLWEALLHINKINLCFMHYKKDIRANYTVCICVRYVTAGSVAVIHFFHCIFGIGKMVVIYPNSCTLWPWGANWRSLGAIRVHFRPHGIVLRRHFAQSCSGKHVWMPFMGAATYYSCIRSVQGNGTIFLEPYNMKLWEALLHTNGIKPSPYAL